MVQDHRHHELLQVRTMVFGVTLSAEALAAPSPSRIKKIRH